MYNINVKKDTSNLEKLSKEELIALMIKNQKITDDLIKTLNDKEVEISNKEIEISKKDELIEQQKKIIALRDERIAQLLLLHFGVKAESKKIIEPSSEYVQISLFDETEVIDKINKLDEAIEKEIDKLPEEEKIKVSYVRKKHNGFNFDESNLERREVRHDELVPSDCKIIGYTKKSYLVREPAICYIRDEYYPTYKNKEDKVIRSERLDPIMTRGMIVSSEFIASSIYNKYVKHIPLYRQEQEFKRNNIALTKMDLCNYISKFSKYAEPVHNLIREYIQHADNIRADETTATILEYNSKKAKVTASGKDKSYIWVFLTGNGYHPAFDYKVGPGRDYDVVREYLPKLDKVRYLQSDGYDAYCDNNSYGKWKNVPCMTHIRRGFANIIKLGNKATNGQKYSQELLDIISLMYQINNDIVSRNKNDYETIKKEREEKLKPLMESFFEKCFLFKQNAYKSSKFERALNYALNRKENMMNFFLDGRIDLDNNYTEREGIKPFVIGRKNWLFSNTSKGAEISSMMFSLVETAMHNNLDPYKYIKYLIDNLPAPATLNVDYSIYLPWSDKIPEEIKKKK